MRCRNHWWFKKVLLMNWHWNLFIPGRWYLFLGHLHLLLTVFDLDFLSLQTQIHKYDTIDGIWCKKIWDKNKKETLANIFYVKENARNMRYKYSKTHRIQQEPTLRMRIPACWCLIFYPRPHFRLFTEIQQRLVNNLQERFMSKVCKTCQNWKTFINHSFPIFQWFCHFYPCFAIIFSIRNCFDLMCSRPFHNYSLLGT